MLVLSRKFKESVIVTCEGCGSLLTVVDFVGDGQVVCNWHDLSDGSCEEVLLSQDAETELRIGEATFSLKVAEISGRVATLGLDGPTNVRFLRPEAREKVLADAT